MDDKIQGMTYAPQIDWKKTPDNRPEALKELIEQELRFEPYDFETVHIEGVPVHFKHIPTASCMHMRLAFKYGAIHDAPGKEGTAHFLEHMIFDGSSMFKDEHETQEFGKNIMLDSLNAYTGLFELVLTGKCLPVHLETTLAGLWSMILSPKLTRESWAHEQKVILQEAWGRFLNEKRIEYIKKERANNMRSLPDRMRIASSLGWPETISAITHEDITLAHKTFFIKENIELYILGNFETIPGGTDRLIEMLQAYIQAMPSGTPAKSPFTPSEIVGPVKSVFDHTYSEIGLSERQQASINIESTRPRSPLTLSKPTVSTQGPEANLHAHLSALTLASDLIGDLVFRKLRLENSWCYGAGAHSAINPDSLGFSVVSQIDFNHIDDALGIIQKIIDDIKNGHYRQDFEHTKRLAIDNTIARERSSHSILDAAVESMTINGRIIPLREYLLQIADVQFEDVQKLVADYFAPEYTFTEIVRPVTM